MSRLHASCTRVGPDDPATLELDADADAFAWCAGRETSLRGVVDQTRELRERGLPVHWRVPLIPERVHRLEALFSLAREEGALPMLLPPAQELSADDRLFAWDFVRYRLLEAELAESGPDAIRRHLALERSLADPATRADLPAPVAPPSPAVAAWGQARDVAGVLADGLRALGAWGLAFGRRGRPPAGRVGSVVLIGAYGGDHIGDAAIVGGVLRRLNARHGTERAVLMSQRPTHTRHLVEMLDAPAEVRVDVYERDRIREALLHADALVYAGGPLTDIPKQLVRHLHAVSLARRQGKPFWIEGVGVGPFQRAPSEWVARRLVAMADRIAVRTRDDARQPQVEAFAPEIGRDPAFDYLESRGPQLTRLRASDREWIERLLEGAEGRPCIGLNLRPINALFTAGAPQGADRASYTRGVEERFESELALGLRRFQESCAAPPRFVFYPMNAIQFGRSDLTSAWRIARRLAALGGGVDFRVWEGDASIDGVVALLRRLDAVIAMRFHAVIYALSQRRPVIGIDYRPGRKDKVGYLLDDFGRADACTRIDLLQADWLAERLSALCRGTASADAGSGTP